MGKRRSGFQFGSGCFKCESCGRNTRDVDGNADCGLCPDCHFLAGLQNGHSDEGHDGKFLDCQICHDQMTDKQKKIVHDKPEEWNWC